MSVLFVLFPDEVVRKMNTTVPPAGWETDLQDRKYRVQAKLKLQGSVANRFFYFMGPYPRQLNS